MDSLHVDHLFARSSANPMPLWTCPLGLPRDREPRLCLVTSMAVLAERVGPGCVSFSSLVFDLSDLDENGIAGFRGKSVDSALQSGGTLCGSIWLRFGRFRRVVGFELRVLCQTDGRGNRDSRNVVRIAGPIGRMLLGQ